MTGTARAPLVRCPHCFRTLDAPTDLVNTLSASADSPRRAKLMGIGSSPAPGDLSICLGCNQVLRFNDDLGLAKIELPDLQAIFDSHPAFAIRCDATKPRS